MQAVTLALCALVLLAAVSMESTGVLSYYSTSCTTTVHPHLLHLHLAGLSTTPPPHDPFHFF
jgi:hypothetical protein